MNDDVLGGNVQFVMSQADTPITWEAAALFNTTDQRLSRNGGGLGGYAEVTQDNLAAILRAMADLELEVQRLKRRLP